MRALPLILALLAAAGPVLAQSAPAGAQKPAVARKPPAKIDPATVALAEKTAGAFTLTSADGTRRCAFTLKAEPAAGGGFAAQFDRAACAPVGFAAEVAAWVPDPSGALRLVNAQGRTLVEFTEATGGSYEALREGDGVYFLASPAADGTEVKPEEMVGDWNLARAAGADPVCRWTLTDTRAQDGGYVVRVAPGCEAAITQFGATRWLTEGGNVLVYSSPGASPLRFARQEDGGWAKVPERGRPLLLLHP